MIGASAIFNQAWAMEPTALEHLISSVRGIGADERQRYLSVGFGRQNEIDEERKSLLTVEGGAGIIEISGPLMQSVPSWFCYFGIEATQYSDIDDAIEEAVADGQVERIVLRVSSPGGTVAGVQETADAIYSARYSKPVEAFIADIGASGAYWLAAQAHKIRAGTNAIVGSIGVYSVYRDYSKAFEDEGIRTLVLRSGEHKGMGVVGAPITDAQAAAAQKIIDGLAASFVDAVARGRGMSRADAEARATGEVWLSQQALVLGIVDAVGSFKESGAPYGFAASEETMSDKDAKTAADETIAAERQRAAEITQAFAADPAFALAQVASGASLLEARAAYADVLSARIAERDTAHAAELAEAKARATEATEAAAASTANPPIDPARVGGSLTSPGDFVSQARGMAVDQGISVTEAMRHIARSNPELHSDYVAGCRKKAHKVRVEA